jgi:hypothetical protein
VRRRDIAALLAAFMLTVAGATAQAGPPELVEHVRRLLETGDLPETEDNAAIEIIDNGKKTILTGRDLKAAFVQQLRVTTGYKLKEFKLDSVECKEETCTIRYNFRTWTKIGSRGFSQSIHSEEEYRMSGSGFTLIRAHQVQKNEDEL